MQPGDPAGHRQVAQRLIELGITFAVDVQRNERIPGERFAESANLCPWRPLAELGQRFRAGLHRVEPVRSTLQLWGLGNALTDLGVGQPQPVIPQSAAGSLLPRRPLLQAFLNRFQASSREWVSLGLGQVVQLVEQVADAICRLGNVPELVNATNRLERQRNALCRHLRQGNQRGANPQQVADRLTRLRFSPEGVAPPLRPWIVAVLHDLVPVPAVASGQAPGLHHHVANTSC